MIGFDGLHNGTQMEDSHSVYHHIAFAFRQIISPIICVIGLMLNLLTLFLARRCSLINQQQRTEHLSIPGLLLMLVLDTIYCAVCLASDVTHVPGAAGYYLTCVVQLLTSYSAWVLVIVAVVQYILIHRTSYLRKALVRSSHVKLATAYCLAFINCLLLALPSFWMFDTHTNDSVDELDTLATVATNGDTLSMSRRHVTVAYLWARGAVNVFVPLCVIGYVNIRLILVLRQISSSRHYHTPYTQTGDVIHRQQLLVVMVIVALYVLLVYPYELIAFCCRLFYDRLLWTHLVFCVQSVFRCLSNCYYACKIAVFYLLLRPFRLECCKLMTHVCPGRFVFGHSRRYVTGPNACPEVDCRQFNSYPHSVLPC